MDQDLLNILVCPKTKKKLIMAGSEILESVNKKVQSGKCTDIGGDPVSNTVSEGLYQPDDKIFYMIRDGIPLLIYENGIKIG
ncbi:MAG: hypothetical protein OEV66_04670 [Spirochaetia bacterium]|nr:hypothetical protein [Spirochaetia bacterium]